MEKNEVDYEVDEEPDENHDETIIKAFKTFDVKKKGYLECHEFKHILKNLCEEETRFTDSEIEQIFKEADLEHDGRTP